MEWLKQPPQILWKLMLFLILSETPIFKKLDEEIYRKLLHLTKFGASKQIFDKIGVLSNMICAVFYKVWKEIFKPFIFLIFFFPINERILSVFYVFLKFVVSGFLYENS